MALDGLWLENPRRKRKSRRSHKPKGGAMAKRRRKRAKRTPRRRAYRRRAKRNMPINQPKRRRRSRGYRKSRKGYRRNRPPLTVRGMTGLGTNVLWAGAGFIGVKFAGNMAGGMLAPWTGPTAMPLVRIVTKAGLAYGVAWLLEATLGRRVAPFNPIFLGGMVEVIQDTVRTYITPQFPMLAGAEEPVSSYEEIAAYEELKQQAQLGQGWDTPEDLPELVADYETNL